MLRLNSQTAVGFFNRDDRMAQLRFSKGELLLRVRHLEEGESFEVDTPNAAITVLSEGEYRFDANPDTATTLVVVRHGEAEVTGGGQAFSVREGNSAQVSGTDQLSFDVQYAPEPDGFEGWAQDRDAARTAPCPRGISLRTWSDIRTCIKWFDARAWAGHAQTRSWPATFDCRSSSPLRRSRSESQTRRQEGVIDSPRTAVGRFAFERPLLSSAMARSMSAGGKEGFGQVRLSVPQTVTA